MSKLRLWMHLCVIVLVIENIHHHFLLQVLLEILIIKLNLLLKGFDHHVLEISFLVALVNVNEALIVLLQRVHVCHLHILNILGVMLQLVLALLLLRFQKEAHIELSQWELAFSILSVFFGIHCFLEVDKLASLMSSEVDVTVTDFFIVFDFHDFNFDEVISGSIFELVEVLQGGVASDGALVILRL